jgi:hypothetical protein
LKGIIFSKLYVEKDKFLEHFEHISYVGGLFNFVEKDEKRIEENLN